MSTNCFLSNKYLLKYNLALTTIAKFLTKVPLLGPHPATNILSIAISDHPAMKAEQMGNSSSSREEHLTTWHSHIHNKRNKGMQRKMKENK